MRRKLLFLIAVFLLFSADKGRWDRWLEEVAYLITPLEKKIFLSLKTDKEREEFVKKFWLIRDPDPSTPVNEFKEEYYRRWRYVIKRFSSPGKQDGWKTDMGRIYLLLGKPIEIQYFDSYTQIYPCQLWLYRGDPKLGLPSHFYLLFYKPYGVGRYKLYNPSVDGPERLLTPELMRSRFSRYDAYRILREISPELAQAAVSFIPGEGIDLDNLYTGGSTNWLLTRIYSVPKRIYENALRSRKLKGIVEVSQLLMAKESSLCWVATPFGDGYLIHLALQPEDLALKYEAGLYRARLKLMITVNRADGTTFFKKDRELKISVSRGRYTSLSSNPIVVEEVIALLPGLYRLSVILRNSADDSYYSHEEWINLISPPPAQMLALFGVRQKGLPNFSPFLFKGNLLFPNPSGIYSFDDVITVAILYRGVQGQGRIELRRFDKTVRKVPVKFQGQGIALLRLRASELGVGKYSLQAYRGETFLAQLDFKISDREGRTRPSFLVSSLKEGSVEELYWALGKQFLKLKNPVKALLYFESHLPPSPKLQHFLDRAEAYIMAGRPQRAVEELKPFSGKKDNRVGLLLAQAYMQLREFKKALKVLSSLPVKGPAEYRMIGDCFYNLGEIKKAKEFWQKSLSLDPSQKELQKKLKS